MAKLKLSLLMILVWIFSAACANEGEETEFVDNRTPAEAPAEEEEAEECSSEVVEVEVVKVIEEEIEVTSEVACIPYELFKYRRVARKLARLIAKGKISYPVCNPEDEGGERDE